MLYPACPYFLAVYDPGSVFEPTFSTNAREVRSSTGFGKTLAEDCVTGSDIGQETLLLRLADAQGTCGSRCSILRVAAGHDDPCAGCFQSGDHGSTFGGNPIATAAGLAVIETIEKKELLARVGSVGVELMADLALIEGVKSVRGAGLLIGIEFDLPIAKQVASTCQKNGVLVNGNSETVIRIAPPLIVTDRDIAKFLKVFTESVHEVKG